MLAVLKVRFKKVGVSAIVNQKFILLEAKGNDTRFLLESTSSWETIMRPGYDVTMSILLNCSNLEAENPILRDETTWYVGKWIFSTQLEDGFWTEEEILVSKYLVTERPLSDHSLKYQILRIIMDTCRKSPIIGFTHAVDSSFLFIRIADRHIRSTY